MSDTILIKSNTMQLNDVSYKYKAGASQIKLQINDTLFVKPTDKFNVFFIEVVATNPHQKTIFRLNKF